MDDIFEPVVGIFDIPEYIITEDIDDAIRFLEEKGAVAVKTTKPVHKTEVKGVYLWVKSADELEVVFRSLERRFGGPVLVQEMVEGVELFVGCKKDPQFGPVVLFGIGGIYIEVYKDVSARVAPFGVKEAEEMILEIQGAEILKGKRGKKIDIKELARRIALFSERAYEKEFELDVNPLIAFGNKFYAVDVRSVLVSEL